MKRQQNAAKHAYLAEIFTVPIIGLSFLFKRGSKIERIIQATPIKPIIPSEARTVIDKELARDILYPIPIIGEDSKSKVDK